MGDIRNKISDSSLITIDIESFQPDVQWKGFDIADFLEEGLIVREKPFREALKQMDFSQYAEKYAYIYCSTEAIFPEWVYVLISQYLMQFTQKIYMGNQKEVQNQLLTETLASIDYTIYQDKSLIVKGCSNGISSTRNLLYFFQHVLPYAKSIMFGEACSAVPLYKRSSVQ